MELDDKVTDILASGPTDVERFRHAVLHRMANIAFSFPDLLRSLLWHVEPQLARKFLDPALSSNMVN